MWRGGSLRSWRATGGLLPLFDEFDESHHVHQPRLLGRGECAVKCRRQNQPEPFCLHFIRLVGADSRFQGQQSFGSSA